MGTQIILYQGDLGSLGIELVSYVGVMGVFDVKRLLLLVSAIIKTSTPLLFDIYNLCAVYFYA
jgi:hypothetical protein